MKVLLIGAVITQTQPNAMVEDVTWHGQKTAVTVEKSSARLAPSCFL